jgi:hypothetical protein
MASSSSRARSATVASQFPSSKTTWRQEQGGAHRWLDVGAAAAGELDAAERCPEHDEQQGHHHGAGNLGHGPKLARQRCDVHHTAGVMRRSIGAAETGTCSARP